MYNPLVAAYLYGALRPRPKITLSEASDKYRYVSKIVSAHPGQWKTSDVPYAREIMDAISNPDIQYIVIRKPSQVSGTEIILNAILYFSYVDPSTIIWVLPTLEMAEGYSKVRLSSMINDSPVLKGLFKEAGKKKKSDDTILHKIFPYGRILMVGSNSETGLSGNPMRIILCDEIDKYEMTKGGDSIELVTSRAKTFEENKKVILTSTPSITGLSSIDKWYEKSNKGIYEVPCYHCGTMQVLKFTNITGFRLGKGNYNVDQAFYECPHCNMPINDDQINIMVSNGKWRFTAKPAFPGIYGFDIGLEIISPWVKIKEPVKGFLNSKNDQLLYREWCNLSLGESHNDTMVHLDADKLENRAEDYDETVPMQAGILTGAVDVQDDRLEVLVIAWGLYEEAWAIEHQPFYGDPSVQDFNDPGNPWTQLDIYSQKVFEHESGNTMTLAIMTIDSRHHKDQVHAFCKSREARNIWPVQGVGGSISPVISKRPTLKTKTRERVFNIGTYAAKEILYSRLLKPEPGPGYFHFPKRFDRELFEQIASEKKVVRRDRKRRIVREFVPTRARNEMLDMLVYNFGGLRILNPTNDPAFLEKWVKKYSDGRIKPAKIEKRGIRVRGKVDIWK